MLLSDNFSRLSINPFHKYFINWSTKLVVYFLICPKMLVSSPSLPQVISTMASSRLIYRNCKYSASILFPTISLKYMFKRKKLCFISRLTVRVTFVSMLFFFNKNYGSSEQKALSWELTYHMLENGKKCVFRPSWDEADPKIANKRRVWIFSGFLFDTACNLRL